MPLLTINARDLHGEGVQGVAFTLELLRDTTAGDGTSSAVYGPSGWYAGRRESVTTDASGVASIEIPATVDFSVQTLYRVSSGARAADFTMPASAANLHDRLFAEDVVVSNSAQTGEQIVARLEALEGEARLDYDAVEGGPPANAEANVGVEYTQVEKDKLRDVEADATADQSGSEIVAAIDTELQRTTWQDASAGGLDQAAVDLRIADRVKPFARTGGGPVPDGELATEFPTSFRDLDGTPDSYAGQAGRFVAVNPGETGTEFVEAPTGGASSFAALSDTPATLGTTHQVPRIAVDGDFEFVGPTVVGLQQDVVTAMITAQVGSAFLAGNTNPIDIAKIPPLRVVGNAVHTTTFTAVSNRFKSFDVPWVIPLEGGIVSIEFEGVDLHTFSTPVEIGLVRALPAHTVSGGPPQSSEAPTPQNHITVRLPGTNLPTNAARAMYLARDADFNLLIFIAGNELNSQHSARVYLNQTTGAAPAEDTGGGATGQTEGTPAGAAYDVIARETRDYNTASLAAQSDGGVTTGTIGTAFSIVSEGNVGQFTFAGITTTGPDPVELLTVLPDGSYSPTGVDFPQTGETVSVELPSSVSNGTQWVFAVRFTGTVDFGLSGGVATAVIIRYHEKFAPLAEQSPAASNLPEGWGQDFIFPVDPATIDSMFVRVSNSGRTTVDIEIPTGNGDIPLIHTFTESAIPTNPFATSVYAFLLPEHGEPVLALSTNNFPTRSYLTFVFITEYDGGPIIGVRGITTMNSDGIQGIGFDGTYNLSFRFFARRRA